MPLPTTNRSLNAIHVEVGGTSGTQVSLNDADVRGIGSPDATYAGADGINTTSGTTISIGEFRNATDTWSATLTVAAITTSGPKGATFTRYGFISGSGGSLSDTTVDTLSNHTISTLASNPDSTLGLRVTLPASGWTSIRLYDSNRDNTIARTSMTYASASGLWYINNSTVYITSTNGATMTVEVII